MTPNDSGELLRAQIFHTPGDPFREQRPLEFFADGGLVVQNGRIAGCGDYAGLRNAYPEARIRDWRGGFLLPGFVDTHVHYPQVRILGGLGHSLLDWLEKRALPEEAKFAAPEYARQVAGEFVSALAAHGTTTALVFGSHFAPAVEALFEAAQTAGLRILSGLVLADRALRPELHTAPETAYRESRQLICRLHGNAQLVYVVTPRFALSASEAMLEVCQTLLAEHPGLRFQTHLNENPEEIAAVKCAFPWAHDYLEVYERFQLVGPRSVLAHSVHSIDSELDRLAAAGAAVAHCPSSNAALGSGIFPLRRHIAHGVRCALGTDVGGGTGFGMLKEGLNAYLMQRLAADGFRLSPAHLLFLATRAGAAATGLDQEIGDFQPGRSADFVYLRPQPGTPLAAIAAVADSAEDLLGAIFTLAGAESVRETRVANAVVFSSHDDDRD